MRGAWEGPQLSCPLCCSEEKGAAARVEGAARSPREQVDPSPAPGFAGGRGHQAATSSSGRPSPAAPGAHRLLSSSLQPLGSDRSRRPDGGERRMPAFFSTSLRISLARTRKPSNRTVFACSEPAAGTCRQPSSSGLRLPKAGLVPSRGGRLLQDSRPLAQLLCRARAARDPWASACPSRPANLRSAADSSDV